MVLRNKDGSIYKVNGPNPLVKDQNWDEFVLHNWKWDFSEAEKLTKSEKLKYIPPPVEPVPEEPEEEKVDIPEEEKVDIPEPVEPKQEVIPIMSSLKGEARLLKNIVLVHCLPPKGLKFTFEAVIVQRESFHIVFWAPIKLEMGSVIYPSVYVDGNRSLGDYQWWKVNRMEPKKDGFLMSAIISDLQPDFS